MTTPSQTTGYAIESLACLAMNGRESMLVREIAEQTKLPFPYLSKIFQRLAEAGIVQTKRGYKGGVSLRRLPSEINLHQIEAAVEVGRSRVRGEDAEVSARPFSTWQSFHRAYLEKLSAVTLAEVLSYEQTGGKETQPIPA